MATITVNALIERAFRKIGMAGDDRNLPGFRVQEALDVLNTLLDHYSAESGLISYESTLQFNLVAGQEVYELSHEVTKDVDSNKIIYLKHLNITDNGIRYHTDVIDDYFKWEVRRTVTITGRPRQVYLQNSINASNLNFDVFPDKAYVCNLKAKFALDNVTLSTNLSNVPNYYTSFLIYALARELRADYPGSTWDQHSETLFREKENNIKNMSDIDLIQKTSVALLTNRDYFNILDC